MTNCFNDLSICNSALGKPDIVISEDEEYKRFDPARFSKLPTAFQVAEHFLSDSTRTATIKFTLSIFRKRMEL